MQDPVEHHLRQVIIDLNAIGATGYALIGWLAMGARVEPRYTNDIDFGFAVDNDEQAEQLTGQLIRSPSSAFHLYRTRMTRGLYFLETNGGIDQSVL